jgi:hypothetical protein
MFSSLLNNIKSVAKSFSDESEDEEVVVHKKPEKKPRKEKVVKSNTAQLTPKELANKKKEPWVDVIAFRVNKDNIRNGFYELDWNEHFVVKLKNEGYGYDGDPDEEIVERWFREICINSALEEGIEIDAASIGSLDVSNIKS